MRSPPRRPSPGRTPRARRRAPAPRGPRRGAPRRGTARRSASVSWSRTRSSSAEPAIVSVTSVDASAGGMPRRTAASTCASTSSAQYAGPTPPVAPAIRISGSGTSTTVPSRPNSSSTCASAPRHSASGTANASTPRRTSTGVFGSIRMTGVSGYAARTWPAWCAPGSRRPPSRCSRSRARPRRAGQACARAPPGRPARRARGSTRRPRRRPAPRAPSRGRNPSRCTAPARATRARAHAPCSRTYEADHGADSSFAAIL